MSKNKEKALEAREKPAPLGPDLDLGNFRRDSKPWSSCPVSSLPDEVTRRSLMVGIRPDERDRAGTYFQIDHSVVFAGVREAFKGRVEVMSTKEAIKRYGWLKDYWWNLVAPDTDKYTAKAELEWDNGYFLRVLEGEKVTLPLQSCLFLSRNGLDQNVHNVIIAEPDSDVQVITGCVVHPNVRRGLHIGVSEFYVKEGAKLTFTMIHNWSRAFDVRPRTAAVVDDGGLFVSNYICLKPVRSLQMYPVAYCKGADSRVRFNSILYGTKSAYVDVGSKVVLQGPRSRGEVITRAISSDNAQIYARGLLMGEHRDSRAHLECRGLLLSDRASIHAIPELIGRARGTDLSHEAAVGKIAEEQVQYLMARGFSESEAESLIVRGFMDTSILGLPRALEEEIKRMVESITQRTL